GEYSARVK
ncbi:MAG: hypothetical protein IRA32_11920, partial [Xanthomonas citri pv. citri]